MKLFSSIISPLIPTANVSNLVYVLIIVIIILVKPTGAILV